MNAVYIKNFKASGGGVALSIPSLVLEQGKSYALLGKSGNGKSLLLSLLFGFPFSRWISEKNVEFEEFNLFESSATKNNFKSSNCLRKWMKNLGKIVYMPQFLPVDRVNNVPICKDIVYTLKTIYPNISKAEIDDVCGELEKKIGGGILEKRLSNLSGGERKRVEILVRICGIKMFQKKNTYSKALILLDEPTSGLDVKSEKEFIDFIKDSFYEIKDYSSIVVATHSLYLLKDEFFNEALMLKNCSLFEQGSLSEMRASIEKEFCYGI